MIIIKSYFLFHAFAQIFYTMSILKESANLSHHSLQSFIIDETQTINAYQLPQLNQHPNIGTLSEKMAQLWKTFCSETYKSAKEKSLISNLNQKQLNTLRKLSVLNLFQQKNSIPISVLCSQLEVQKIALFKLLTEMSSKEFISVKIDEKSGICHILASKRRQQLQTKKQTLSAECLQRLGKVLSENVQLVEKLSRTRVD